MNKRKKMTRESEIKKKKKKCGRKRQWKQRNERENGAQKS